MKQLSRLASFYIVIPFVVLIWIIVFLAEYKKWKRLIILISSLYFAIYIYVMFLYRINGKDSVVVLSPFHSIRNMLKYLELGLKNEYLRQCLFNIFVFIPLGLLLSSLFRNRRGVFIILIGIVISVGTEIIQYLLCLGWADIDDVINNTCGLIIGIVGHSVIRRIIGKKKNNRTLIQNT